MVENDYSEYVKPEEASTDRSAHLVELAHKQIAAEAYVEQCQTSLDEAKKQLKTISTVDIPELMADMTLSEFKLDNGFTIKVDENIQASIPVAKKPEAFSWLRDNNHGKLLKHIISFSFAKGEDDKASRLKELVDAEEFEYEDNTTVHASTLKSFVKEKLKKGEELPAELFSVFRQKFSKITTPK